MGGKRRRRGRLVKVVSSLLLSLAPGITNGFGMVPGITDGFGPGLPSATSVPQSVDFVLSSFNVLGSKHTATGGDNKSMAPGSQRVRWAIDLLNQHEVDVVGFQELESDQLQTFLDETDGAYDVFPGSSEGGKGMQNSIAWRTDNWELVRAHTIPIPYFNGDQWPMPVVLLRNRATGLSAYFSNFHNPASTRHHPDQGHWRDVAISREVAMINRLISNRKFPVFLTGDLNSRDEAFCAITGQAPMSAANGGSNDGLCRPPQPTRIDWIYGSPEVTFSGYEADESPAVQRTSDHPLIVTQVHLDGAP